jgi:hypothetical protein
MRKVLIPVLAVMILTLGGCAFTGSPWREPMPDAILWRGPLDVIPTLLSPLEEDDLQVTLIIDDTDLQVGDTFHWMAKIDNPVLEPMTVKFKAKDPSQLLRFDQGGALIDPITGAEIFKMRAGIGPASEELSRTLPREITLESMTPQVIEATGTVVEGERGRILLRFNQVEIILPARGSYNVFLPVLREMGQKYTLGRIDSIREERRSTAEQITIR